MGRLLTDFEQAAGGSIDLIRCDDRTGGVADGRTDAATLYGTMQGSSALRAVELGTEDRVAAVSRGHPLARRRRLRWPELAGYALVVNAGSGTVGPELWPRGARPQVAVSCRTYDEWMEMVAAGRGFGVLPASARQHPHPAVRHITLADAPQVSLVLVEPARAAHPLPRTLQRLARGAVS